MFWRGHRVGCCASVNVCLRRRDPRHRRRVPLYGDGTNVRDWIYVEDNCEAILRVLMRGEVGEACNIGAGCEVSNLELVRALARHMGVRGGAAVGSLVSFVPDRPGHDLRYGMACGKVRRLGWEPKTSLEEGIAKTVAWYREHPERLA